MRLIKIILINLALTIAYYGNVALMDFILNFMGADLISIREFTAIFFVFSIPLQLVLNISLYFKYYIDKR